MRIELEYSLTPDDALEFNKSSTKISPKLTPKRRKRPSSFFGWLVIVLLAVLVFIVMDKGPAKGVAPVAGSRPPSSPLFAFVPYIIIFILAWLYLMRSRFSKSAIRKTFESMPQLAERKKVTLTDQEMTNQGETSTTTTKWNHFIHFDETENVFLLFDTPASAHILPKRAFGSVDDLNAFRLFAQAHVGNQAIGFPVGPVTGDGAMAEGQKSSL